VAPAGADLLGESHVALQVQLLEHAVLKDGACGVERSRALYHAAAGSPLRNWRSVLLALSTPVYVESMHSADGGDLRIVVGNTAVSKPVELFHYNLPSGS
jgi:hypothetical protein